MNSIYFIILNLIFNNIQLIHTENTIISANDFNLTFGHIWDKRNDTVTIYFDISNLTFDEYRYYYYDFRPFALPNHIEYFPRQRLIDTHNSLNIIGLHENDYVSCISFIDEYENIYKPRFSCYEFTLGEKIVGSHHGGSSGYLSPLLLAFTFVIHVFIAIIHHIKSKNYVHKLLQRFINVNPKRVINVKHSLKQLDHRSIAASVQRRLSRVAIDTNEYSGKISLLKTTNDNIPMHDFQHHNQKQNLGVMKAIPEYNP